MRIIFWGNGNRGVACLRALRDRGYCIDLVVVHPSSRGQWYGSVAETAGELGLDVVAPPDPNDSEMAESLKTRGADLFVLAGYGKILHREIIDLARVMAINLHAGKVPEYRGSSPLNWALINGEDSFGLSILKLDAGVDSGAVLLEREFEISADATIGELHAVANEQFPAMLLETIKLIETGEYVLKAQDAQRAGYFPLRFPDDGLILWDQLTAKQIHNRIRALTEPYPCAFTFYNGREVRLLKSELASDRHYGEPGRVYRVTDRGVLVCAADECLWLRRACFTDGDAQLADCVQRYDRLATVGEAVLQQLRGRTGP